MTTSAFTFIIPGGLSHLESLAPCLGEGVCGILIHEKIAVEKVNLPKCPGTPIYTLSSLVELTDGLQAADRELYEKCLVALLSDPRAHYLATRSHLDSAFNNSIAIEKVLVNSIRIIRETKPLRLVSSSTPHSVEAWVFAKTFEMLGLPAYILERTPINDRAWIYRGLDSQEVVGPSTDTSVRELTESSQRLIREQRNSKPGVRDQNGFFLSRMDLSSIGGANTHKWWSYRRELRLLFSGKLPSLPLRILSVWFKRTLLRSYQDVAIRELPKGPFIVFFMHYQPERSSLPEGLFHVQQWLAIRLLAWSLPSGWTLLVREHPTTWLLPLDISVRTRNLYREIALLRNTRVCSMDIDTFELIDHCSAAATLTGSVGFQAILRSKPVIVFGLPAYKDHPACLSVSGAGDLDQALEMIREGKLAPHLTDAAIARYLAWIERNSLSADPGEENWLESRLKNFAEIYRRLFSGEIELH